MDEESKQYKFVPREYQLELLEEVKKRNTILYLPTGSGKTYIATMLIKDFGESLNKPTCNGRKWTFFIVQSVPLVAQQANSLRKHLPWTIGTFSGDMNVDFWSKCQWENILDKCHILVMTAQIYLNNLLHGYMNIRDANLIIFDECHHAVSQHPFRKIMQVLQNTTFSNGNKSPHILGLTATLINSNSKNIKDELAKLQQTFSATIKTRYDGSIQLFSARPKEFMRLYDEHIVDEALDIVTNRIKQFVITLRMFKMPNSTQEPIVDNSDIYYYENQKTPLRCIANHFLDIEIHFMECGVYAAYLSTWHYTIEIEKQKRLCNDHTKFFILSLALTEITVIRKCLHDYMLKNDKFIESASSLKNNGSPKIKELMKILSSIKRSDNCLIFVDRRTTAKFLYHYITDYAREFKLDNIVCDFIVGARGTLNIESRESIYKKQQNNDIIKMFNDNKINVLVTSEVLEEGVDIQSCNYVIRFDSVKTFPSYVQSKGRARCDGSKFIVMVPNLLKFKRMHTEYIQMEVEIDKILVRNDIDDDVNEDNLGDTFETKFATLTHENAIAILNRYCHSLPQDRFTNLSPQWYIAESTNDYKKYKLKLPINSVIKTPIDGMFCKSKKNAKKSAAFNACIELYKIKAINDHLLPLNIESNKIFNDLCWFPHWDDKDIEAHKYKLKPGTNKMRRMVHIESPSYLRGAYPQVGKTSYLHVIHCVPKYDKLKDSNYEAFDKLLKSNKEFGILTSKILPRISDFPIFLHFGDVDVNIKVNITEINLSQKDHNKLELFHNKLFLDVLGVKDFIIRNYSNGDNSYLIVPIYSSDNTYNVDWNVIDINEFVEKEKPTTEQKIYKFYNDYLQTNNVISPWYRNIVPIQKYVVTDVLADLTPESPFPTSEYNTYKSYFNDKYNINLVNKNQPMIKVKSLGVSKINYLVPRSNVGKTDKRNEYIEILVPEFCIWHKFPSVYWLKSLMLPTILYRINKLLLAEDLLVKINSMCNIEVDNNLYVIDNVQIDNYCGFNEVKKKKIILPISDTLKYLENTNTNTTDWNSNSLPIDIERHRNTTMLDVLNYHTFMFAMSKSKDAPFTHNCKEDETNPNCLEPIEMEDILNSVLSELNVLNVTNKEPPLLTPLSKQTINSKLGPRQSDILKVITPPFANDMFHYERMETYGDSFLKFACALVLFDAYELENEGVLTELKMKLVGNRNLFYVGKNLNIGSYMVMNIFEPNLDWTPPCFSVPHKLKEIIEEGNLQSDVLHQINIPREDKIAGKLSDNTWVDIETEVISFKKLSEMPMSSDSDGDNGPPQIGHSQSDLFINKQSVSDKMVADCIESLIGTYVYFRGVEVGFKILRGLGIIPKEFIKAYKPKITTSDSLTLGINYSHILPGYEILERRIGYSFKNKELLIQALTHPTYQFGYFECYQRLEFLGDAILDFLITTYIIDHCKNKTPGEITDIRSALVNNITFASLSIRIGLHRFILAKSVQLTEAIDRFYEHQQKNSHKIGQEVLYLIEEGNCYAAESIDVPKVLGDLFESLIGAIYIDCDKDLTFVWSICYRFLENEIHEFCTNVPKNPIRILHETKLQPGFSRPKAYNQATTKGLGTMIQLDIMLNGNNQIIYGFGQNKKEAKVAAAKMALKNMKKFLS